MADNLFPHYLFGNYVVEIAKLFKYRFMNFQTTSQAPITPLQVYYGTPRAAFRYWYQKFNGQLILPLLNFYGIDYRRRFDKECPNTRLTLSDPRSYDPESGTVTATFPPMHYDVTYQFSIYNNNMRERDKLIHKIQQLFPRGSCSIQWYPDPEDFPDIFLFMPLTIDESFSDETEVEGLDQDETRNVIRTTFNMISSAVLPYDVVRIPCVKAVFIDHNISEEQANGATITINNVIGNTVYWHTYYSNGFHLSTVGGAYYAIDQKWYYNVRGEGVCNTAGIATANFTP